MGTYFLSFKLQLLKKPLEYKGLFILFFILFSANLPASAQTPPSSAVFSNMIVTPNSTLRAKEGELIPLISDPPVPIIPKIWNVFSPGSVEYTTEYKGCLYQVQISQKND